MLFKSVLAYIVVFYSQIGFRVPILAAARVEFILGVIILIAIGVTWVSKVESRNRLGSLTGSIVFLFVAMALSIPGSYWIGKSLETMFIVAKMFSIYIMIVATVDTETKLRQLMWVYLSMVALIVGEPFLGVFTGSANWDVHRGYPKLMGATGLWAHPNSLGGFAAANLAFLYYLFFAEQEKWKKWILLGLAIGSVGTIVFTGSRTAYVGILGLAFVIWLRSDKKVLALGLLIASLLLTWIVAPQAYKDQFLTIFKAGDVVSGEPENSDGSMSERWQIIGDAWEIFIDHPFLGVGVDAFPTARGERFDRWQDTHNLYLQILTNIGVLGGMAFFVMIYRMFGLLGDVMRDISRVRTEHASWLVGLTNGVSAFLWVRLIVGMFGMDLYENYWWLAAGLSEVLLPLARESMMSSVQLGPSQIPVKHALIG